MNSNRRGVSTYRVAGQANEAPAPEVSQHQLQQSLHALDSFPCIYCKTDSLFKTPHPHLISVKKLTAADEPSVRPFNRSIP
jgi:hypothetical protein